MQKFVLLFDNFRLEIKNVVYNFKKKCVHLIRPISTYNNP